MLKRILLPLLVISTLSLADKSEGVDATYTVPVPYELARFASFKMPNSLISVNKDLIQITYYLPREIIDKDLGATPIILKGRIKKFPEHFDMTGAGFHRGNCFLRQDGLTCLVTYEFTPDLSEVREYLKKTYPASELEARMKVAKAFQGESTMDGGEAGGVVHFSVSLP